MSYGLRLASVVLLVSLVGPSQSEAEIRANLESVLSAVERIKHTIDIDRDMAKILDKVSRIFVLYPEICDDSITPLPGYESLRKIQTLAEFGSDTPFIFHYMYRLAVDAEQELDTSLHDSSWVDRLVRFLDCSR